MKKLLAVYLAAIAALLLLGILSLNSATVRHAHPERLHAHFAWLGLGLAACLGTALVPYAWWRKHNLPWLLLGLAVALLGLVLIPMLSEPINGARRWLWFGGQPSEFAKLALIVALAAYGASHLSLAKEFKRGFLIPGSLTALVAGLIFLEPDWGTAILTGTVGLLMMAGTGSRWRYVLAVQALAIVMLGLLIQSDPERLERLPVFVEQKAGDHRDVWQVWQSVLSFAAGGFWGTWPGEGSHKYGYVAEQETDFILSLVGEELGFVGCTLVVVLYMIVVLAGVTIAWRVNDPFGQLLVVGFTFSLGLQALINIAVVTSTLPNKGLPLPFLSYGGSNLVCLLAGVGWVISVARLAPRDNEDSVPLLDKINGSKREKLSTVLPGTPAPPRLSWWRRRLLRWRYGPAWPCHMNIRYPYQLPPKNHRPQPGGGVPSLAARLVQNRSSSGGCPDAEPKSSSSHK